MESAPPIFDPESRRLNRLDTIWLIIWLVFIGVLAALPPELEWHKQVILLAIGLVQLLETKMVARFERRGVVYVILLKILLATILIDHTGEISINSSYWPIYFLPVVTAALYCGPWMTLFWTLIASASYCSYLYPAMQEYEITAEAIGHFDSAHYVLLSGGHGRQPVFRSRAGIRPSFIGSSLNASRRRTAAWSRRRPKRGARSGWPRWDNFRLDSRMRFAIRWALSKAQRRC